MPSFQKVSQFILNSSLAGHSQLGYYVQEYQGLQFLSGSIGLAHLAITPKLVANEVGSFGDIENPTGVAIDRDNSIYISDSRQHRIFKVTRCPDVRILASFFLVKSSEFSRESFVYIPIVNRVERWSSLADMSVSDPAKIEVISDTAWNRDYALDLIQDFVESEESDWIEKEWEAEYPGHLIFEKWSDLAISPLPTIGGLGALPRQLNEPRGLAISESGDLYVADSKNNRIQIFSLRGLFLKAIWGQQLGLNEPWDVAINKSGDVWVADTGNHRLQKFTLPSKRFEVIDGTILSAEFFQILYGPHARSRFVFIPARRRLEQWPMALEPSPSDSGAVEILSGEVASSDEARQLILENIDAVGAQDIFVTWEAAYPSTLAEEPGFERPTHLATDHEGRVYVVDQNKTYVKVLNQHGRVLGRVTYAHEISDRFQPTSIALNAQGQLLLAIGERIETFTFDVEGSHYGGVFSSWKGSCGGIATDREGKSLAVGNEFNGLAELPPSQGYETSGYFVTQSLDSGIENCQWHKIELQFEAEIPVGTSVTVWTYTAETELLPDEIAALAPDEWRTGQTNGRDFLILSSPGRWLWLKVEFKGNGADTPLLKQLKIFFPRNTYLQYLPAVYQSDPTSKDFLERFLSIFESTASSIEAPINQIFQYLNADGVPDSFLSWLGGWVDIAFEPNWSLETRRALLRHAPELYRKRGTVNGLKDFLRLALRLDVEILEHFRLRKWLFLNNQSMLGERSQLWGSSIVNRLQLEENSRIGDFALVGTGDPLRDPFHVYAHKFSVFIPAAQFRSELLERQLNRLLELEKPAYTSYQLCKVEPRFRVGVQSTVGLDTLVGTYPRMVLNHCSTLGYDSVLGGDVERGADSLRVGERARVGVNSVVG